MSDASAAAEAAYARLSRPSKAVIDKSPAIRSEWQELVATVGPDTAIEHAETAGMMGLVSACEAAVDGVMKSYGLGLDDADHVRGDLEALSAGFEDKVVELYDAVIDASSNDQSVAVGTYGLHYYKGMFEVANAILDGTLTDQRRNLWVADMNLWDAACRVWDRSSGRNSLPLVAD